MASRRLVEDQLYDRPTHPLQSARCTLRIRRDGPRGLLTFKGPPLQGAVKIREEIQTEVSSVAALEAIVSALGFSPFFRAQKWREEYELHAANVALDDTPMGVFVEIEAEAAIIATVTMAMGRHPADWLLESYQRLFTAWATARGLPASAMLLGEHD